MQTKDVVTLVISSFALLVALYGIYERRATIMRSERVRLSEIFAELHEKDRQQMESGGDSLALSQSFNSSREILSQQASSLLKVFRGKVTSVEYRTLAAALKKSGYSDDALKMWRIALAQSRSEGAIQLLFCLRGFGLHLFERGNLDEAREFFAEALEAVDAKDRSSLIRKMETYVWWADSEVDDANDLAKAAFLLDEAMKLTNSDAGRPHKRVLLSVISEKFGEARLEALRSKIEASG